VVYGRRVGNVWVWVVVVVYGIWWVCCGGGCVGGGGGEGGGAPFSFFGGSKQGWVADVPPRAELRSWQPRQALHTLGFRPRRFGLVLGAMSPPSAASTEGYL